MTILETQIKSINEQRISIINEIGRDFDDAVSELFSKNKTEFILGQFVHIDGELNIFISDDGYSGIQSYVYNINCHVKHYSDDVEYELVDTDKIVAVDSIDTLSPRDLHDYETFPYKIDFWYGVSLLNLKPYIKGDN